MTKEQHEWIAHDSSQLLSKEGFAQKILKKIVFFECFWQFPPPFYAQVRIAPVALRSQKRANCSCCSFVMSDMSYSITSLFTKEQPWANRSGRSLQKNNRERFAQIAHDKSGTGAIWSFKPANRSLVHKKRVNRSKYWWANSQPWPTACKHKAQQAVKVGPLPTYIRPNRLSMIGPLPADTRPGRWLKSTTPIWWPECITPIWWLETTTPIWWLYCRVPHPSGDLRVPHPSGD